MRSCCVKLLHTHAHKMIKYVLLSICLSIPMTLQGAADNAIVKHGMHHANEMIDNEIIEYLEEGHHELRHSGKDENVFFIGLGDSEKTTTALILTDDNSKLISTATNCDEQSAFCLYDIVDETGSIGNSQVHQKEIISNLLIDEQNNIAYYDCPAYDNGTRDVSVDTTGAYFVKEIFDSSTYVKFILNINYESVNLTFSQAPMIQLLEHVSKFIIDVDKYQDAIGAVITNVDQPRHTDDTIKLGIILFFDFVQRELLQNLDQKPLYKNAIKIINILSQNSSNVKYEKIALVRTPDRSGPVSEIRVIQDSKWNVHNMITKHIKYVKKSEDDFNYLPSDKSQEHMVMINRVMNDEVYKNTKEINDEFEAYFRHIQQNYSINNDQMKIIFTDSLRIVSDLINSAEQLITLDAFIMKLNETISNIEISIPNEMNRLIIKIDFLNFLEIVSNIEIKIDTIEWVSIFQGTVQFLDDALNGLLRCQHSNYASR